MTPTHQFCLKWNNHSNNLLKVFGRLFSNESFTDVTLAAEGRSVRAHKMVLSACSTYFEQLFLEHPEPNPIVIMRETSYTDLAIIVEFMYKGEINVSQEQLGSLLRTAESLRVKGLAQASTEGSTGRSHNGEPAAAAAAQAAAQAADEGAQHPNVTPPPFSPPHSASSSTYPHVHPPPALLPLFQSSAPTSTVMDATSGGDSPSLKRKRGRPKMDCGNQDLSDSASSPPPSIPFIPRMENMVAMSGSRSSAAEILEAASTSSTPGDSDNGAALDLRLTESSTNVADLAAAARMEMRNSFHGDSEPLRKVQQEKNEPHCYFRGYAVYKFNDYIAHGTRQQYWEEPFTKAVMEGIQDRELDLKKGAELLGVSYSTLYGRYRESHGYLRHAWTRVRDRPGGDWWDAEQHELLSERLRRENGSVGCPNVDGLTAEELVVEVDSYDVLQDEMAVDKDRSPLDTKESLILSIRHGKVQRKLAKEMLNKQPT